ncbi:MAG: hypothetical protein RXP89_03560 [Nitrososphaeria archaeon]
MRASVFTPAAISSFFAARIRREDGSPIDDPLEAGAVGGGFALRAGVRTSASVRPREGGGIRIRVLINGREEEAPTTRAAASMVLGRIGVPGADVEIRHESSVPIGSGFGTSASGAMGAALAISIAMGRPLPVVEASRVAHAADVVSGTGLGTAEGLVAGGIGLVVEPGALWRGRVEKIPLPRSLVVVAVHFGPIDKRMMLRSPDALEGANRAGREALRRVLASPDVRTLMSEARRFAEESGMGDREMLSVADDLVRAGALGATQNMIGRAVHAVVRRADLGRVVAEASRHGGDVIVSGIHDGGPVSWSRGRADPGGWAGPSGARCSRPGRAGSWTATLP